MRDSSWVGTATKDGPVICPVSSIVLIEAVKDQYDALILVWTLTGQDREEILCTPVPVGVADLDWWMGPGHRKRLTDFGITIP